MTAASKAPDFSAMARQIAAGERPVTLPQTAANAAPGRTMGNVAPFGAPGANQNGKAALPPAEFYLNIGVTIPLMQEDGSTQDTFVSIGGVTLRPDADVGKTSGMLASAKRDIHAHLLRIGYGSLEPGQAGVIDGSLPLQIEFRRPRDPNAPASANESAVSGAIAALFGAA